MQIKPLQQNTRSILALVFSAFLGALMGVWVRNLNQHFELFQQIALRAFLGAVIGLAFYYRKINFKNLQSAPKRDFLTILFRSISVIIGISLYSFAIIETDFANVSFISALPMTAVIGVILFQERLTRVKILSIIIGFAGVVLISVRSFNEIKGIGIGELAVLISTIFYSLAYISRKWMSNSLSNQEMTIYSAFVSSILAILIFNLLGNGFTQFADANIFNWIIALCAGLTFILIGFFNNIGFEHLEIVVANNIMALGSVFGLLIGLVIYQEIPDFKAIIGGILVVISAIIINNFKNK